MELGAAGCQIGTRLVCSHESIAHDKFKEIFIKSEARNCKISVKLDNRLPVIPVRAIENNRWIIRATDNGFSAIIDNKGTIVEILDQNVSNVLESKVKLVENASIFNKFGYMFNYFFSFIIILLFIARALWKKLKN